MVPILDYRMVMETIMKRLAPVFILFVTVGLAGSADAAMFGRKGECNIKIVSYQVTGDAGQTFAYAGKAWTIPAHGKIEILAKKNVATITVSHQPIDLSDRRPNAMGIVTLNLEELGHEPATIRMASGR